ncbi:DUF4199 domain-containing protein [Roseateles asaccharophilus]|uniref:DUF4199 domain-containing protein n=1 Tax=Roseateles asaccharophilus TaxID=582607 RepID=A0ABU2A5W6_9BURK|nr:DUF4199 domain-containing protein [Roseateles asaccharophilus]MDR7332584.1 hypothetical protein [Roseateles asaccharophilus]
MLKTALTYGLAAGLIAGIPLFALVMIYKGPPPANGMLIGSLIMAAALSLIFVAIRRRRDRELGGSIAFGAAFLLGLAIVAVAGVVYASLWEITLAVSKLDFGTEWARIHMEQAKLGGASEARMAEVAADMERFKDMYSQPLLRFAMTACELLPVGLAISLASAALLRNPRFMPARKA